MNIYVHKKENIIKINEIIKYMVRVHISYKDPLRIITLYQNKKNLTGGERKY